MLRTCTGTLLSTLAAATLIIGCADDDAADRDAAFAGDASTDVASDDRDATSTDATAGADVDAGADSSDNTDTDADSGADALTDIGDDTPTDTADAPDDAGGGDTGIVPLFDESTELEPALRVDTGEALVTRFADRARDRHAREDEFQSYDHYLPFYWEHRTTTVEIIDPIGHGGDTITFNVTTQWPLREAEAELRFFYRGLGTVAEYYNNGVMTALGDNRYTRTVSDNGAEGRELRVGDRMEFELSQFLDAPPRGRINYYGTTFLYIVGEGIVPWQTRGVFGQPGTELEDSYPIPEEGRLGGGTTLPYQYSNEPNSHLLQMATNLAPQNGQTFVLGRRVHHTNMLDGTHTESAENGVFAELNGLVGGRYVNTSCSGCHINNGRGTLPESGLTPDTFVFHVGEADGSADPMLGSVLQPFDVSRAPEGQVVLSGWNEVDDGLRTPVFAFPDGEPAGVSPRIALPLVGMGLLEAIPEAAIVALADPDDADGDGISGRARTVVDPITGQSRLGRFGWTARRSSVREQVASALNTDMGVMTEMFPEPDCGSAQGNCEASGGTLPDAHLETLTRYVALLGVRARRDLDDAEARRGEDVFDELNCSGCHTPSFETSPHHPLAELRSQTIMPYSDLLLHDMGPGLASTLPEDGVSSSEWRTPPLWGLGLADAAAGENEEPGQAFYLHDGRARTIDEAIRWHGGEAEASRAAYESLGDSDQQALLAFLRSL